MLRSVKGADWSPHLLPEDLAYLEQHIDLAEWYPMATFERLGNAILRTIARNDLQAVRLWGRLSTDLLQARHPDLVAPGDPIETLNRFRVLRSTFFDFDAIEIPMLVDGEAEVTIQYGMGMPAEEAACHQTVGFFERQLELSGAIQVSAELSERSWKGAARTRLLLSWQLARV
jgi:hypothetical protein